MAADQPTDEHGSLAAYRLPSGRHGLPAGLVAENQRWRLLGAAAEVLAMQGYAQTTSARIARCAGVSSTTFYRHFDNMDACLLAAFETSALCVSQLISEACEAEVEWSRRLHAAISATLDLVASDPALGYLLGSEAAAGVAAIREARERLVEELAVRLRGGAGRHVGEPAVPAGTPNRRIAAALALLSDLVVAGEAERLPGLADELTELLAAP